MRYFFFICLFAGYFSPVMSQDIIVLRKNEQELKCRIISLNDTLVTYRLWHSPDTTTYKLKKFEVLSFMMDTRSQNSKKIDLKNAPKNNESDLLGEYHFGEVVEGFVIKENDEMLRGFIRVNNVVLNQLEVHFISESGDSLLFTPNDIKAYGYSKLYYERMKPGFTREVINGRKPENGLLFLHLAIDGPSKLYRFYAINFKKSTLISYGKNPPFTHGRLKRSFVITNPAGKKIFTKGRTLQGALNRIYNPYPKFLFQKPVYGISASELPGIINSFNYWFENQK